jgi:class 3 adenylate cyclase/TolB-like protein/ketosteroid isomerase-like protein
MAEASGFTRRVCAVLLADVTGFSALMGKDDEGTARVVRGVQALVRDCVARAGGEAEAIAGDSMLAIFDSVISAVEAAVAMQERIGAEDIEGKRIQVRIGVHLGDVLFQGSERFGDAINVAARLQALAEPGTICISEAVYRQVQSRFEGRCRDLGRQRLKNVGNVHAYLLIPASLPAGRHRFGNRSMAAAAVAVAVALVLVTILVAERRGQAPKETARGEEAAVAPPAEHEATEQVVLGVMLFEPLGDDPGDAWMREALRDGLNAQLSRLSGIKVYSKEFLDFLMTRQGLTAIEAATRLGISKMLSGSFVVVGDRVRVETRVVDVASGVLEDSYTTEGPRKDFLALQDEVTLEALTRMELPITDRDRRMLAERRTTNVEALRLLLDAERAKGGGAPVRPTPDDAASGPRLSRWSKTFRILLPSACLAADESDERVRIRDLLDRYRHAMEAGEVEQVAAVHADFSAEQAAAQRRYLSGVRGLRVSIDDVDIAVVGDEAVVSFTRSDDFADVRTGRPMQVTVRLTKMLVKQDGEWKLAAGAPDGGKTP